MIIIYIILGLIVGSFLNALIHRLATGESIAHGRSKCPSCGHELAPVDLVPVLSFIYLAGKCRYCGKKISWQYPIVELVTAVSFFLVAMNYGSQIGDYRLWFQLVFVCFFIVIAVFDLKHYLILDKVLLPAGILALIFAVINGELINGLLGVLIISGFFAAQFYISKGHWIGFGDVKFGIVLGLLFGMSKGLILLFLSYCAGAAVGLILIAMGRKHLSSRLPFGTFLSFCGIIILLYGDMILQWYLNLIGF